MSGDALTIIHVNTERFIRGGELQMFYLAEELRLRGHQNYFVLQPGSVVVHEARRRNFEPEELRMKGEWDLWSGRRLLHAFERHHANLVHAHTPHAGSLALIARGFNDTPPIVLSRRVSRSLKKNPLSAYKYRAVDAIIAVSELIARNLVAAGISEKRIFVAESGTPFSRFENALPSDQARKRLSIPERAFVIGNVGHFDQSKGQPFLIQAFSQLVRRNSSVLYYLLLVGEGPALEVCRDFANRLDLSDRVIFTGYQTDIENYYPAMDLMFHSSLPTGVQEGWSGAIREAMACGIPVIALRQPALEEQIEDGKTGILLSAEELNIWVETIERMYGDTALRLKLSNSARAWVQRYTVQRMAERTENCYRTILNQQQNALVRR